jgi:hypothetical protein
MTSFSPTQDRIAVFSQSLGQHAEVTGLTVVKTVLKPGDNVSIDYDPNTGTATITGPASRLPASGTGYLHSDGTNYSYQPFPTPTVGDVSVEVDRDSSNNPIELNLTASRYSRGFAIDSGPSHGSASISGSNAVYTPNAGYAGDDAFTYHAYNLGGNSNPATVHVNVKQDVNAPTAPNVSVTVSQNTTGSTNVGAVGTNITGYSIVTNPQHGTAAIDGAGNVTYTPATGYIGADVLTYSVTNAFGTKTGTVSITVIAAPVLAGSNAVDMGVMPTHTLQTGGSGSGTYAAASVNATLYFAGNISGYDFTQSVKKQDGSGLPGLPWVNSNGSFSLPNNTYDISSGLSPGDTATYKLIVTASGAGGTSPAVTFTWTYTSASDQSGGGA